MEMQIYLMYLEAYYDDPVHYLGEWFVLPVSESEVNQRFGRELARDDYVIADYDFPFNSLNEVSKGMRINTIEQANELFELLSSVLSNSSDFMKIQITDDETVRNGKPVSIWFDYPFDMAQVKQTLTRNLSENIHIGNYISPFPMQEGFSVADFETNCLYFSAIDYEPIQRYAKDLMRFCNFTTTKELAERQESIEYFYVKSFEDFVRNYLLERDPPISDKVKKYTDCSGLARTLENSGEYLQVPNYIFTYSP